MSRSTKRMLKGNVRDAALSILQEIDQNEGYSNVLLHRTIGKYALTDQDRGLLTELTYGTLQHRLTLDYYLQPFLRSKVEAWVRELLRLSLYQIVYLTKIPPHAAVNEAVEIAKRRGHKGIASMVNGVLRSILRHGVRSIDEIEDRVERLSVATSHPKWLIERWIEQYGFERTKEMAEVNNVPPRMTARVNRVKATVDEVLESLQAEGIEAEKGEVVPECIITSSGNFANTTAYREGKLTIQDESSMLPVVALQLDTPMKVLDMCAAPGGKTTFIAEKMLDQGEVLAYDVHEHKLALIRDNAHRLGLGSIVAKSGDSRELAELYAKESFDRILIDAPCSGFGVIRRKPEIKYTKLQKHINELQAVQEALLDTAFTLLKPGGLMVYSTCTVDKVENEQIIERFLQKHDSIVVEPIEALQQVQSAATTKNVIQILPQDFQSDGFFIAALRKKR